MLTKRLKLAPHERRVLRKMARSRKIRAGDARRARVILRLAKREPYQRIMLLEGCGSEFITRWKKRFEAERLAGLYARHRGRPFEHYRRSPPTANRDRAPSTIRAARVRA